VRQSVYIITLAVIGLGGWVSCAEAAHVRHHPWGAHKHAIAPVAMVPAPEATKPATVAHDKGRQIASQALTYEGTRYKYGGTSKKGMDCSGLVSRIYEDLKMHRVPRVSSALYKSGRHVDAAELRPGDLVFFKNTYKRGISHVGVYAGNNKFVHAANKKHGVIVTSLADPYYQIHFAGARRLY